MNIQHLAPKQPNCQNRNVKIPSLSTLPLTSISKFELSCLAANQLHSFLGFHALWHFPQPEIMAAL